MRNPFRHTKPACAYPVVPAGAAICYAQEGEDMILRRIFEDQPTGFYVDVGALDPVRFSNTYYFYQQGWRGVNIDATPGSMAPFAALRPRDINVEAAVSDIEDELMYYIFNEPALNGFSAALSAERDGLRSYRIVQRVPLRTSRLAALLDVHLPPGQAIDFFTVDAEGYDLQVLRSNDWCKYRPKVILAEDLNASGLDHLADSPVTAYLHDQGYRPFAKTLHTAFYQPLADLPA